MGSEILPGAVTCLACGWVSLAPPDCPVDGTDAPYRCSRYRCEGQEFRPALECDAPPLTVVGPVERIAERRRPR